MSGGAGDDAELLWRGKFLEVLRRGRWEYAARTRDIHAAVILAVDAEDHVFLISQHRVPLGCACLELPAGLVGDEDAGEAVTVAAGRELEEEIGYRARTLVEAGRFASSPGMTSESFTLILATDLERVGAGGGLEGEDIAVHRVARADVPRFVAQKRAEGLAIDAKLLLLLGARMVAGVDASPPSG